MFRENLGILKLYMNGLPILSFLYATNVGIEKKGVELEIFKDIVNNLPWWLVIDFNVVRSPKENLGDILTNFRIKI